MAYPNIAIDSNFYITISNMPGIDKMSTMKYYEEFVRSVSIPAYDLELYTSPLMGGDHIQPLSRQNNDLGELSITFKISEDYANYFFVMYYMMSLRYGVNNVFDAKFPDRPRLKQNAINEVVVFILDNQKNIIAHVRFKRCFITNLSGLDFNYGSDEELEFSVSIKYTEITFDIVPQLKEVECGNSSSSSALFSLGNQELSFSMSLAKDNAPTDEDDLI